MYRNTDEIEKLKKIKTDSDQEMEGALKQLKELSESRDSMPLCFFYFSIKKFAENVVWLLLRVIILVQRSLNKEGETE